MRLPFSRSHEFKVNHPREAKAVPIAGDAAIATPGTVDGKLVPLLILDTRERPDIAEAIKNQASFPEGDVTTAWGKVLGGNSDVALFLRFLRPTEVSAVIEFAIPERGILVEHILMAKAVYLQAGKPGDRLVHDTERQKMIVEVPDTGFRPQWDKIYAKSVTKRFRTEGLSRTEAKSATKRYVEEIRGIARFRVPRHIPRQDDQSQQERSTGDS